MKTFREKAAEIAASYVSTQAIEKLMTYAEKNPQVWADVLKDEVTLRVICTAVLAKENNASRNKWQREAQSDVHDRQSFETQSRSVAPTTTKAWTPEQERQAREADRRAELKNRQGIFSLTWYGYVVGDLTRKTAKEVENKFRTESTSNARKVAFFKYIRENLPDDKARVRDHFTENQLKVVFDDTDTYVIVRKRHGKAEEKV